MKDCNRVLHVLHSVNCGGAETLLMNIYRRIDRSRLQFDFLVNCFEDMYFEKEVEALGGRLFRMKFLTQVSPPVYSRRLKQFFSAHPEYRVVHSHLETTSGLILRAAQAAGVTTRIAHSHNTRYPRQGVKSALENAYKDHCKALIVPCATQLFACSEPAATWMFGDGGDRATIIRNGADIDAFALCPRTRQEVRAALGIEDQTKVFGHVGRFFDQKNHHFLIDAFAHATRSCPDSRLLLVGDGELMPAVQRKVSQKKLQNKVLFLGIRADVHRLMQAMDVFVLPSRFEGLPLVLVEAQAAGLPCLVSSAVSPEADMGCGLLRFLTIDDSGFWGTAMASTQVHTHRQRTGGQIAANGYDIVKTARQLEELYFEMYANAR